MVTAVGRYFLISIPAHVTETYQYYVVTRNYSDSMVSVAHGDMRLVPFR
jgi:hypothetical protein